MEFLLHKEATHRDQPLQVFHTSLKHSSMQQFPYKFTVVHKVTVQNALPRKQELIRRRDSERELFTLCARKLPEFAEITQNNAITPSKVIQGHRFLYQSIAHIRLPISD